MPELARRARYMALPLLLPLLFATASSAEAQRRPGVGMGFYTYTGLLSAEVEGGNVQSSSGVAEAALVAISAVGTAPLLKVPKRAWIAAARITPLSVGNRGSCYVTPQTEGCQDTRFEERAALMTGGAFDIRSTLLRVMAGVAYVDVEGRGARYGSIVRLDYASPRQRGATPALFASRTFLGSERGDMVALTTIGVSFRWVRKQ